MYETSDEEEKAGVGQMTIITKTSEAEKVSCYTVSKFEL